jgi:NAD(P)-dependent dehydrogenase (short-subunit alcohol dehydrogenase family)
MDLELAGRAAIVTGGSRGIGKALTRTERTPAVVAAMAAQQGISEQAVEARMAEGNVLGRIIDAREVADVVTFLASVRAIAVNGDAVVVGGGGPGCIHY